MKIGLLQTDYVSEDHRESAGGDLPEMFANLFFKISKTVDLDVFDVIKGEYPNNYDIYDGFIITGSKFAAFDNVDWIIKLKYAIVDIYNSGKKIIGICFGHQILAQTLGGSVARGGLGLSTGIRKVETLKQKPWMTPFNDNLNLLFCHQDMVVELPEKAELIATSDYCQAQMFCIDNQILGIQAHPEMPKEHNRVLMKKYQKDITNGFDRALESLSMDDNSLTVGHWIANFFAYKG